LKSKQADEDANRMHKTTRDTINASIGNQKTWADSIVSTASAVMSLSSAISMLGSLVDTLQNPDMSGWEKFLSVLTTLGMVIPMVIMAWKAFSDAKIKDTIINGLNAASEKILADRKARTERASRRNTRQ